MHEVSSFLIHGRSSFAGQLATPSKGWKAEGSKESRAGKKGEGKGRSSLKTFVWESRIKVFILKVKPTINRKSISIWPLTV